MSKSFSFPRHFPHLEIMWFWCFFSLQVLDSKDRNLCLSIGCDGSTAKTISWTMSISRRMCVSLEQKKYLIACKLMHITVVHFQQRWFLYMFNNRALCCENLCFYPLHATSLSFDPSECLVVGWAWACLWRLSREAKAVTIMDSTSPAVLYVLFPLAVPNDVATFDAYTLKHCTVLLRILC